MTKPLTWNTLITITKKARQKCPALRITAADSDHGQKITFTFCLYEEPKLQTILHLPYSQMIAYNALIQEGIILVESNWGVVTAESLEREATNRNITFLPRETEIQDHRFTRTKPNPKFYPFQGLLRGNKKCDAITAKEKEAHKESKI